MTPVALKFGTTWSGRFLPLRSALADRDRAARETSDAERFLLAALQELGTFAVPRGSRDTTRLNLFKV